MPKARTVAVLFLAFWLAFGHAASVLAQSTLPCDSMAMSMAAGDCCDDGVDAAKCLTACLSLPAAMASPAMDVAGSAPVVTAVSGYRDDHPSHFAPPDKAPPKSHRS